MIAELCTCYDRKQIHRLSSGQTFPSTLAYNIWAVKKNSGIGLLLTSKARRGLLEWHSISDNMLSPCFKSKSINVTLLSSKTMARIDEATLISGGTLLPHIEGREGNWMSPDGQPNWPFRYNFTSKWLPEGINIIAISASRMATKLPWQSAHRTLTICKPPICDCWADM